MVTPVLHHEEGEASLAVDPISCLPTSLTKLIQQATCATLPTLEQLSRHSVTGRSTTTEQQLRHLFWNNSNATFSPKCVPFVPLRPHNYVNTGSADLRPYLAQMDSKLKTPDPAHSWISADAGGGGGGGARDHQNTRVTCMLQNFSIPTSLSPSYAYIQRAKADEIFGSTVGRSNAMYDL